jgi:hypothetical protein
MAKLPKNIIKKYGISKKAWQVFRGQKKSSSKKTAVYKMARKKRFGKKSYKKSSGFSLGSALKVLSGAALAAAYEVFVSPMIPLGAQIKNIIELVLGLVLAVMPKMPTFVRSFGAALATVNAYALVYPMIAGVSGNTDNATWS